MLQENEGGANYLTLMKAQAFLQAKHGMAWQPCCKCDNLVRGSEIRAYFTPTSRSLETALVACGECWGGAQEERAAALEEWKAHQKQQPKVTPRGPVLMKPSSQPAYSGSMVVEYKGEANTLAVFAARSKQPLGHVFKKLSQGMSLEAALSKPRPLPKLKVCEETPFTDGVKAKKKADREATETTKRRKTRSTTQRVAFQGKTQTFDEWAIELNISSGALRARWRKSGNLLDPRSAKPPKPPKPEKLPKAPKPPREIVAKNGVKRRPSREAVKIELNGKCLTFAEWSVELGISALVLRKRWKAQGNFEKGPAFGKQIEHDGRSLRISEWAALSGVPQSTLGERLRKGEPMEEALRPAAERGRGYVTVNLRGDYFTYAQLEKLSGIGAGVLRRRVTDGWTVEDAVSTPLILPKNHPKKNNDSENL